MGHEMNFNGNLRYIYDEVNKNYNFQFNFISKEEYLLKDLNSFKKVFVSIFKLFRLFTIKAYYLARSKYIFLDDNFLPMAYMNLNPETNVFQLWHASGAFKKFGLSNVNDPNLIEIEQKISEKLDYIIVSSENVIPYYAEAFGVENSKVLPLGVPRTDFYFKENVNENKELIRKRLETKYPEIKGKKLVLYAPTFRDDSDSDRDILNHFDMDLFNDQLKNEYCLLVRLHPNLNHVNNSGCNFIDVTSFNDEKELLLISDILITDYSSIMIEYALLNKPMIFYPYDYEYYKDLERGFYFEYEKFVPGPIAFNTEAIIKIIKNNQYKLDINEFLNFEFDHFDGKSTKRVVSLIINNKE